MQEKMRERDTMGMFLLILLIVVGYFLFFLAIVTHMNSRIEISFVALVALIIYGCSLGILVSIGKYVGNFGIILYVVSGLYSIGYWIYRGFCILNEKNKIQWGAFLTLFAYVFAVLYITLFMRVDGADINVQMHIFNWLNSMGDMNKSSSFQHMLLNFCMFLPIGAIFPFITENKERVFGSTISFGILVSFLIETSQLLLRSGVCDIDDIISNTLGTVAGVFVVTIYTIQKDRNRNSGKMN